ncbi:MAG TPA: hypothetical protein VFI95_25805 [Terriglobales bacterium]|nr:hypothetical protein [Terriglobales bacterium]
MTVRRLKTYTGGQGYVYQYYFVGKREALPDSSNAGAAEYIFDVTPDRKTTFSVSVFVQAAAVAAWASAHGRKLTEAEEYAAVKLRLFRGFDEIEDMMKEGRSLQLDLPGLEQLLGDLGVS